MHRRLGRFKGIRSPKIAEQSSKPAPSPFSTNVRFRAFLSHVRPHAMRPAGIHECKCFSIMLLYANSFGCKHAISSDDIVVLATIDDEIDAEGAFFDDEEE